MARLSAIARLVSWNWIGVAAALTRDPISAAGLIALALSTSLYLLPVVSSQRLAAWSEGPLFLPLIGWAVVATLVRSWRSRAEPERQFWRTIGIGSACWLAAVVLTLLPVWSANKPLIEFAYDALVVTFYLGLILATTKAPHAPAGPRRHVGATPILLGTVVFGVGMTAYFDLVPYLVDRADFDSRTPALYLFLALDLSLLARTAAQVRSARDTNWRIPYWLIFLAALLLTTGDLLDLLRRLGLRAYTSGTATDFLWYSIYVSIALAAGLRQTESPRDRIEPDPSVLFGTPLLTFAFIVPVVHFVLSGAGLLGARSQHPREAVALATMAGVLVFAWLRQTRLERHHLRLQRDLERERERLRNAERLEAVGRLAGGLAHDNNSYLTVILGYGEILAGELADRPDLLEPIEEIREAARRAADLTKQLLSVGQRQVLFNRELDMNQLVAHLEPRLRDLAGASTTLEIVPAAQPAIVLGDRSELEGALINLATNSIEAMPRGGRLRLVVSRREPEVDATDRRTLVQLEVVDDGHGMNPEVLAHASEPFFTTKTFGEGSGLGLASTNGIVYQSGGTMSISSAPGRGTTVRILLPEAPGNRPSET